MKEKSYRKHKVLVTIYGTPNKELIKTACERYAKGVSKCEIQRIENENARKQSS